MEMIRAIIVDDELAGIKTLQQKLKSFAGILEVAATFQSPLDAIKQLPELNVDVVFLDVEMPGMNGFQFLQSIGTFGFEVIFTTAYNTYTLDALRVSALDYLLKPVEEEELESAVQRLQKRIQENRIPAINPPQKKHHHNRLALPTAEGIYLVKKTDIIRVEAMSNYSTFHLSGNKKIVVSKTLKEYEAILEDGPFLRINRSAIVNLDYTSKYRKGDGGTLEMIDGMEVEVSPNRKDALLSKLFE